MYKLSDDHNRTLNMSKKLWFHLFDVAIQVYYKQTVNIS